MDIVNPSILPGFMELLPDSQKLFDNLRNTIERNFKKYGFLNIDTPLIEKEEILLSKGGGETSKQIYRIDKQSTKQALRFDLTVSLARYVSMHANDLNFPFRRYQIGKVYRGERNQKGRYREFYQCDIDIVGNQTLSLLNDAEIPSVIYNIFKELGFEDVTFKINNRKLLQGYLEHIGINEFEEVLRTIDKIDKIGKEKIFDILVDIGISDINIKKILNFISSEKDNLSQIIKLESFNIENDTFKNGIEELKYVYENMKNFGIPEKNIKIDLSITRGLDYYTGMVYETFLNGYESIGSVCSGGRYENLANNFSKQKYPGVGLSIGLTRLFYQLNEIQLLENQKLNMLNTVLVIPMSEDVMKYSIDIVNLLRENNISSQVYLESGKVKKKFSYADNQNIKTAIIIGEDEKNNKKVSVRDFISGKQDLIDIDDLITYIGGKDENYISR